MAETRGEYLICMDAPTQPELPPYFCRHCLFQLAVMTVIDGKPALTHIHPDAVISPGKHSIIVHCPACGEVRHFAAGC